MRHNPNLAEQSLIEAYSILCSLAGVDRDDRWETDSAHKHELDKLAQKLRYKSIEHLVDRWYEPRVDDPWDSPFGE